LSRALDALRQLGNLPFTPIRKGDLPSEGSAGSRPSAVSPGVHPEIRRLCREAVRSINRYPVKDPLAFETLEEEEEEDVDEEDDEEVEEEELGRPVGQDA